MPGWNCGAVSQGAGHGLLHQVLCIIRPACQADCHAMERGEVGQKAGFKALIVALAPC